ncbi:hypothetical protein DQ239_02060 [Blastococcus sp. TF02-09]|nr:hypothetical protein DQ239_02060 [Blastococcus sp. TF02-9]
MRPIAVGIRVRVPSTVCGGCRSCARAVLPRCPDGSADATACRRHGRPPTAA